ncbi:MAG: hypothetical protein ACO3CJ_03840 [Burkholderiaceae bacterium]
MTKAGQQPDSLGNAQSCLVWKPWFDDWWTQSRPFLQAEAQAGLLVGPARMDLGAFALALAAARLCHQPAPDGRACGKCPSCRWVAQGQHPDCRWIRSAMEQGADAEAASDDSDESADELATGSEAAAETAEGDSAGKEKKQSAQILISQIRVLQDFAGVSSHRGGSRWAVIGSIHRLNVFSANALLKGLEEPESGMRYLLYAERLRGVPATILSRCRRLVLQTNARSVQDHALGANEASSWLLPFLTGQPVRVQPTAWAARVGKTTSIADAVELLLRWLIDMERARHGLEARHFPKEAEALRAWVHAVSGQASAAPYADRYARLIDKLLVYARGSQHPVNAQLYLESVFEDLRQLLFPGIIRR